MLLWLRLSLQLMRLEHVLAASPHNCSVKRLKLHLLLSASAHRLPVSDPNFKKQQAVCYPLPYLLTIITALRKKNTLIWLRLSLQSMRSEYALFATPHDCSIKRLDDVLLYLSPLSTSRPE